MDGGTHYRTQMDYSKMFDHRMAVNCPFDGEIKAEEWVKKTRNFFLGRCGPTEWMLEWAETRNAEIRPEGLVRAANEKGEMEDVQRISQEIWSFLNVCLSGEGQVTFGLVPNFNGLEAWRTRPVTSQSASKRVVLGQQVRNPNIIKTVDDVMASIEDFVVAGGSPPNDEDKCNIIISKLPEVIQDKVMFKEFTSFAELKRFLQEHTQRIKDLGIRPAVTLNAMDETEAEREQAQQEVIEAIQMMPEGCSRDEILAAVQHITKGKGKGKGGQRKGPTTKRCYTCQEVGHIARELSESEGSERRNRKRQTQDDARNRYEDLLQLWESWAHSPGLLQ